MSPWHVIRWCTDLRVTRVIVENVPEIMSWGPIDPRTGRPIKSRKDEYFRAWVQAFEACGYKVEWRVICCADLGDATIRKRFFLIARNDKKRIRWPQATHAPAEKSALLGLTPWRTARDVINWSKRGTSIFERPRPLSPKTLKRAEAGLRKFNAEFAEPFLVILRGTRTSRSVKKPFPAFTAGGTHLALVQPQLQPLMLEDQNSHRPRGIQATPGVSANGNGAPDPQLEPFMVDVNHGDKGRSDDRSQSLKQPFGTITTTRGKAIVEPVLKAFIVNRHGENGSDRVHSVDEPTPTATCRGAGYVVEPVLQTIEGDDLSTKPFIVPHFNEHEGQAPRTHDIDYPLPTATSRGAGALIEPILVQIDQHGGNGSYARPVSVPLGTIVTKQNMALVEPTLNPADASDLSTDRVVCINGKLYIADILFRMIDNDELAEASSFHDAKRRYSFFGSQSDVTRQIGNGVPARTSEALVYTIMSD